MLISFHHIIIIIHNQSLRSFTAGVGGRHRGTIKRALGTERARLGTFRGLGTERARLGTFRGFGTERARLGTFRGFGTERARLGTFKKNLKKMLFFYSKEQKPGQNLKFCMKN